MIGLKKGMVELKEHNELWIPLAQAMIKDLKMTCFPKAKIEHIGSTSIPTIKAKPIIDLLVGVDSFEEVKNNFDALMSTGFVYNKEVGNDAWMYFNKKNEDGLSTFHLHILLKQSQAFKNHIYFRNYLIKHKEIAKQYESLKIHLAKSYPNKRDEYTKKKEALIKKIIRKAQVSHFLGKEVTITIDRPIGTAHPKHPEIIYPINYGFIANEIAPDDEELDVYLLDVTYPVNTYTGRIIAIVHRENDIEDKLVMASSNESYTVKDIKNAIYFQEQFYNSSIELHSQD
ncbi:MAG: GrpB family protein [Candidatus Izemoplasmataceae bacterium]